MNYISTSEPCYYETGNTPAISFNLILNQVALSGSGAVGRWWVEIGELVPSRHILYQGDHEEIRSYYIDIWILYTKMAWILYMVACNIELQLMFYCILEVVKKSDFSQSHPRTCRDRMWFQSSWLVTSLYISSIHSSFRWFLPASESSQKWTIVKFALG